MMTVVEDRIGELLVLEDADWTLRIDARGETLTYTHQPLIGRARERRLALARIDRIEVEVSDTPSLSLNVLKDLLSSWADRDAPLAGLPRSARISVYEREGRAHDRLEVRVSLPPPPPGDREAADALCVALACRIAAAVGLPYVATYTIQGAGLYLELIRTDLPGALRVPAGRPGADALDRLVRQALTAAGPPPFDPGRFVCDHRVDAWQPGARIVLRRRLSPVAVLAAPVALLVLVGPALVAAAWYFGGEVDTIGVVVVSLFGVLFGGVALLVLAFRLPREVMVDWPGATLATRTWFRAVTIPFPAIERLELEGNVHESSGGDSGSSSVSYSCRLWAVYRDPDGEPRRHELVTTEHLDRVSEPYRQAVPLLSDLARALKVEGRVLEYPFRREKG